MAHIPTALLRRLHLGSPLTSARAPDGDSEERDADGESGYLPTPIDIVKTRNMLSRSRKLPPDLVDSIFDFAEYWAHSTSAIDFSSAYGDVMRIRGTGSRENQFLLRSHPLGLIDFEDDPSPTEELAYDVNEARPMPLEKEHDGNLFAKLTSYPTPRLVNPCRKVVFHIRSHDQGIGGELGTRGTYNSSWTWFEAGLERFDAMQECDTECTYDVRRNSSNTPPPALPLCGLRPVHPAIGRNADEGQEYRYIHDLHPQDQLVIHRNKVANAEWQDHVVTWSYLDNIRSSSLADAELDHQGRGRGTGDGSFVRNLKLGDVVTIWGKARFPMWMNIVESIKIDLYWAV